MTIKEDIATIRALLHRVDNETLIGSDDVQEALAAMHRLTLAAEPVTDTFRREPRDEADPYWPPGAVIPSWAAPARTAWSAAASAVDWAIEGNEENRDANLKSLADILARWPQSPAPSPTPPPNTAPVVLQMRDAKGNGITVWTSDEDLRFALAESKTPFAVLKERGFEIASTPPEYPREPVDDAESHDPFAGLKWVRKSTEGKVIAAFAHADDAREFYSCFHDDTEMQGTAAWPQSPTPVDVRPMLGEWIKSPDGPWSMRLRSKRMMGASASPAGHWKVWANTADAADPAASGTAPDLASAKRAADAAAVQWYRLPQ